MSDIPNMLRSEARIADEDWTGIYGISPNLAFAAADRIEKLEAALRHVMAGGNNVALIIGADHPPYTTTYDKALTHYGAGYAYNAWCCWKAIMEARKVLEGKDG